MARFTRLASSAYYAWSRRAARRFTSAVADPVSAQRDACQRILAGIDLQARGLDPELSGNPVTTWEDVRPLADRVAAGERTALTREAARFVEPSGGSTGGDKLVPYTAELLAEFSHATTAWVHDLMRSEPQLRGGSAYWAVSPPTRQVTTTSGGVPIGVPHDTDYFPPFARRLLDAALGMPRALAQVDDHEAHRYVTLRALLAMDDLALVSVWSPTFLTLIADSLDRHWPRLLHDLEHGGIDAGAPMDADLRTALARALPAHAGRARRLRLAFGDAAPRDLGEVWPRLAVVSCWTDAQAALALGAMRERVPHVRIQGKGLLATEGVTSIPLNAHAAPVAAVSSHVIELLPINPEHGSASALLERDPTGGDSMRAVYEAEVGHHYEVVLTTSGGLVRYRTFDVVEIVGHAAGTPTPLLRFVGRADHVSDLVGEKLAPAVVERALADARSNSGVSGAPWMMVTPDLAATPPRYVLCVDAARTDSNAARRWAAALDVELCHAHHYRLCRELGQLGSVATELVHDPIRSWTRACADLGQRTSTIKPTVLDSRPALIARLRAHGGSTKRAGAGDE